MYPEIIGLKKDMYLKESEEGFMGSFGTRKGKGEM